MLHWFDVFDLSMGLQTENLCSKIAKFVEVMGVWQRRERRCGDIPHFDVQGQMELDVDLCWGTLYHGHSECNETSSNSQ